MDGASQGCSLCSWTPGRLLVHANRWEVTTLPEEAIEPWKAMKTSRPTHGSTFTGIRTRFIPAASYSPAHTGEDVCPVKRSHNGVARQSVQEASPAERSSKVVHGSVVDKCDPLPGEKPAAKA